ncbi:glycosyltransferase [Daejeonella lutea]|uniref:Glycosyltransferase, catalytic subunit of cellulose synthase and poly-beta-1,6-N-acetylglucosamine synthase n=1 Tax=Daejeonella lutea TaxID=572036 RepID=A0A1T5E8L7_9SPHI|nr:glycosyltransferase [Daejeonella lutea]SKB80324.1 Glycosyltransferase, catalytic subunit of cellulose synthase and poly-beta-1,6-N-acetylglucosamine synthase [Daejeonella lutea]
MVILAASILTGCLTLFYVFIILYLYRGWDRIPLFKKQGVDPKTFVSIIIAARNEEGKIEKTIGDILAQNYPRELFELIIVDDHSTDRTSEIITSFASSGVKLIKLNEAEFLNSYKKKAISEAINFSTGELIITTDADCRMNTTWLRTIVEFYHTGNYNMISSPVTYFEEKNAFEEIQTLEFLFLIGLGAAGIGNRIPATCNGANLAYRRDVFIKLNGFQGIDQLASGDDELFLHKVSSAFPGTIGFCKSPDAIVYTHAKSNLAQFIQQRKRWASKSTKYKNKSVIFLGVAVWLFNLSFIVNFGLGFMHTGFWNIGFIALLLKMFVEIIFLFSLCTFLGRRRLLWYVPLSTVLHIIYIVFIGIAGNSGKYNWKGRMVR